MIRVWTGHSFIDKYIGQDENSKNKTSKRRMKNGKERMRALLFTE
jgi:hypothetical protein